MIEKLNLLPWREERRRRHRQRFFVMMAVAVLAAAVMHWLAGSYIKRQQDIQQVRNQQLQQEIAALERQLSLLPELDRQRGALNRRLAVIAEIQQERNRVTRLLSLLPAIVPAGVFLDSLSMKADRITVKGTGESTGRLATFLASAEGSPWLADVAMHSIVRSEGEDVQDLARFKASFGLARPAATKEHGSD